MSQSQLSGNLFRPYYFPGTAESAVSALSKAAKFFEESDPDKAVDVGLNFFIYIFNLLLKFDLVYLN